MPKRKVNQKDILDRFYTKQDIALKCYKILLKYVEKNDLIIEPSAGNGSFSNIIRNPSISYDISPFADGIIEKDWFDVDVPEGSVIIGNPPFGHRNDLSKKFIKHSLPNSKCIGFILPMVYKKETFQSIFPDCWFLVEEFLLPKNSFIFNDEEYHVPCVFQIWVNKNKYSDEIKNIRETAKPQQETNDFNFVDKTKSPDFFIFGASPSKIIHPKEVNKNNRGYYVISNIDDFEERIKKIDWKKYSLSSVNGGVAWFTKKEIINIYCENYKGK